MGKPANRKWTIKELKLEALKYKTRMEFKKNSSGAYKFASRLNLLDEICQHMKRADTFSIPEKDLFNLIKEKYPKTQKLIDRKISLPSKPHIKGFDIDIYIPELRKGIEFDGEYWHSIKGLKRSRTDWPEEDLENYHKIKDEYFLHKDIQILHIKEENWLKDKYLCVKQCFEFLSGAQ
jgi:hypothetical protein